MKTLNIYEKGDSVMVKGIVAEAIIDDNGTHKYRVKDDKSGLIFGTWYTSEELTAQTEEN